MEAIVAVYSDWGIGCGGTQPVVVSADRRHFREVTNSSAVIVGRKTLADFPNGAPLKNRINLVISRQNLSIDGAEVMPSIEAAAERAKTFPKTFVIGGASIYNAMLKYCTKIHVTMINCRPKSDVYFENLDESPNFVCTDSTETLVENEIEYSFKTYERV